MRWRVFWPLCTIGFWVLFACATYSDKTQAARDAIHRGDLQGGETQINRFLKVRKSEELPRKWKSETTLAVLERGMILRALGLYKLSSRDFQTAEKQLELFDIARDGAGQVGKYIFSDSATKYKAPPSEKLVLNAFNMLNYLRVNDLSGASVEARRFTVMRQYLQDYQPDRAHGAFGSLFAGFVFERLGEYDRALRYYDEALQAQHFVGLVPVIHRLSKLSSFRSPRIDEILAEEGFATPSTEAPEPVPAELVVVLSTGRVPYKVPARIPIGLAIGLAGTFITGNPAILEHSAFKVVIYPELQATKNIFDHGLLLVDGQEVALELASNLEAEIAHEYELLKPKIIGAAISRLIVRAAAAEGARAAGQQAKNGAGGIIGLLAAAAVEGAMIAADKPDTRSWTLLPARVFVARIPVNPGQHRVELTISGLGGRELRSYDIDVKQGGYTLIDVTTLR